MKEAYVHWNAGVCTVLTYPGQKKIARSKHFRRATRRAQNLGYDVRVYAAEGSYVLPGRRKKKA
jgi:hypothetical protein